MRFIGVDLHANRFACCHRNEGSSVKNPHDKRTETFDLSLSGLAAFYKTLTADGSALVEAAITTFSFVRLFRHRAKEVAAADAYELKQIGLARCNTGKTDADKLRRIVKTRTTTGGQSASPAAIPPKEIQDLRGLFSTCQLYRKQSSQLKNRIHPLVKGHLYGFAQEEIFDRKKRGMIRVASSGPALKFQLNQLMNRLEREEEDAKSLREQAPRAAEPFMARIDIPTSMKGASVFIAAAIIADSIDASGFKNSKAFTSYLRPAPSVSNSNTPANIRGADKKGRKLASALLTQSLSHVLGASGKLSRWRQRLSECKKAGLVRAGLRRRVFAEIRQMLKKGECHYGRDERNHRSKMEQYRKFLEKTA